MNFRTILLFLALSQVYSLFAQTDSIPPALINFQVSDSCIDVSSSTIDVVFSVEATDNLAGIDNVIAFSESSNNVVNSAVLQLISGTSLNGIYEGVMSFDSTNVEGTDTLSLHLQDLSGNFSYFDHFSLAILGFQDTLKILNSNSDSQAPQLSNFQVSESCINVSDSTKQVTFTVQATDNLLGVNHALTLSFSPNGNIEAASLSLISGTPANGTWEGVIDYDSTTVAGIHNLELQLQDVAGNFVAFSPSQLAGLGYQDTLKVINVNSDVEAPVLVNLQVSESCVNVDSSMVDVIFTVEATDNLLGVTSAIALLHGPNFSVQSTSLNLISGTPQNGIFEGTIQLDTSSINGIHSIELHLQDSGSNFLQLDSLQLSNLGFQSSIKIINNINDISPPELIDLQVSEYCIDVSNNSVDVYFTAQVTDNASGISNVTASVTSTNYTSVQTSNLSFTSGTNLNGFYEGLINLDNLNLAGTYTLSISAQDISANYNSYNSAALANLGFQDTLKLINSNSDIIPPQLINFQISEDCENVFLNVDAIDNFSGIAQIVATFTSTSDTTTASFNIVSGTIQNGIFESTIKKDSFTTTDIYCIAINIHDLVGNSMTYDDVDLSNLGLPNKFSPNNPVICYHTKINTVELTNSLKGLVYVEGNSCNRVTVENDGSLSVNTISCTSTGKDLRLECGDLYIESLTPRLVMKSPNNSCWLLEIDSNGQVTTQSTTCSTANANIVVNGDLIFDYPCEAKGVLLKSSTNSCCKLVIQNNQLVAIGAYCPD